MNTLMNLITVYSPQVVPVFIKFAEGEHNFIVLINQSLFIK